MLLAPSKRTTDLEEWGMEYLIREKKRESKPKSSEVAVDMRKEDMRDKTGHKTQSRRQ